MHQSGLVDMDTLLLSILHYLFIRSKCPNGPCSKQVPVILRLKEVPKFLPRPVNANNTILNIFCKSSFQRLSNLASKLWIRQTELLNHAWLWYKITTWVTCHGNLIFLVRCFSKTFHWGWLHHCFAEGDNRICDLYAFESVKFPFEKYQLEPTQSSITIGPIYITKNEHFTLPSPPLPSKAPEDPSWSNLGIIPQYPKLCVLLILLPSW